MIVCFLLPFVSQTQLYKTTLYNNPYSNADEHQRTYRTRNEQNRGVSSTKRIRADTSEQQMPSPPFGSSEYVLRTPLYLKQGYKGLEVFSTFPVYSNSTATLQQYFNLLISGRKYLLPCRT